MTSAHEQVGRGAADWVEMSLGTTWRGEYWANLAYLNWGWGVGAGPMMKERGEEQGVPHDVTDQKGSFGGPNYPDQ